mgnify:FL=1
MEEFKNIAEKSFFYVVAHGEYNPILELNTSLMGGSSEIDPENIIAFSDEPTELDILLGVEGGEYTTRPYIANEATKDVHFNLKTRDNKARLKCNQISSVEIEGDFDIEDIEDTPYKDMLESGDIQKEHVINQLEEWAKERKQLTKFHSSEQINHPNICLLYTSPSPRD